MTRAKNRRLGDRTAPNADTAGIPEAEARIVGFASQRKLVWLRFKRHRLAVLGGVVVLLFYVVALFAEFIAPEAPGAYDERYPYAPPQRIRLFVPDETGSRFLPHVLGYTSSVNPASFRRTFDADASQVIPIGFLVRGSEYVWLGVLRLDRHLIGAREPGHRVYFWGADRLGRDLLSRAIFGTRVSMTIGLVGVTLSLVLGILLGGISGYFGGAVDNLIQRIMEFLQSMPQIPLWMALAAAIPRQVPPLQVYFLITVILSVLGWTGLARVVRGRFLSLRTEDFVAAAKVDGCSTTRIIMRHMVPSFMSHIIASTTLAVPGMIIAETSLSFLGLGLRPPVVSWGVLLQDGQSIRVLANAPWIFLPGVLVVVAVLGFNFLGDGLRDAADPYS